MQADNVIGWVASVFSTLVMVPQVYRACWDREKRRGITGVSIATAIVTHILWILYSLDTGNGAAPHPERLPVFVTSCVNLGTWLTLLGLWWYETEINSPQSQGYAPQK